jgi:hypothetical protein
VSNCKHGWDWRKYGSCPTCLDKIVRSPRKRKLPDWFWIALVVGLIAVGSTMSLRDECMTDWECGCVLDCLDYAEDAR